MSNIYIRDCPHCGATHAALDKQKRKGIYVYNNAPSSDMEQWPHVVCLECGCGAASIGAWNGTQYPTGTEARVCDMIAARQRLGIAKYGTTVADNPLNLREWLQHALEECLDQAVYLMRAIEEIDKSKNETEGKACV